MEIISNSFSNVDTTFAYNDANEMASMTMNGVTTNFTYDDWGRMVSKYTSAFSADYAYRYGGKLHSITSDFAKESDVTYQYGADGKMRQRTSGGTDTWYNYDRAFNVINEESGTGSGTLQKTYVTSPLSQKGPILAAIDGSTPSTGDYVYPFYDMVQSVRGVYDASDNAIGAFEFTPYGTPFAMTGTTDLIRRFGSNVWDSASQMYFAPYRSYSAMTGRWNMSDPRGMVDGPNMFAYIGGNPVLNNDPMGLSYRSFRLSVCRTFVNAGHAFLMTAALAALTAAIAAVALIQTGLYAAIVFIVAAMATGGAGAPISGAGLAAVVVDLAANLLGMSH